MRTKKITLVRLLPHGLKEVFKNINSFLYPIYDKFFFFISSLGSISDDIINADSDQLRDDKHLDLVTIAFNNEEVVIAQILHLNRYFKGIPYTHIIADNSSDISKRKRIKEICTSHNVLYVEIPKFINWFINDIVYRDMSHGAALNWMYYKFIAKRKSAYFGFIDHDLFPVKDINAREFLSFSEFYGVQRDNTKGWCYSEKEDGTSSWSYDIKNSKAKGWFLFPGFSFFKYEFVKDKKISFLPCYIGRSFLATGGSNYDVIYKNYDKETVKCAKIEAIRVANTPGFVEEYDILLHDTIELIDDSWIHLINASNSARINGKEEVINTILREQSIQKEGFNKGTIVE